MVRAGANTVIVAEAAFPVPPCNEVTALVVLCCVPAIVAVTLTAKVQDAVAGRVALVRLMFLDPAMAAMAPPPQLPLSPFGVATTSPEGKVSVNPTAVRATVVLGLVIVKLKAVELPITSVVAANDLLMTGGATTVIVAEAALPAPPCNEVTALVVLLFTPGMTPVTFTTKVQDALAGRVAPVRLMLLDPAVAVMVPPPQLPVSPFGVETTNPAGSVSVNPTTVRATVGFGLTTTKLRLVLWFSGTVGAANDFASTGGATITKPVDALLAL